MCIGAATKHMSKKYTFDLLYALVWEAMDAGHLNGIGWNALNELRYAALLCVTHPRHHMAMFIGAAKEHQDHRCTHLTDFSWLSLSSEKDQRR